ncbi:MAG: 50S ribosomal protein L9 [Deltaproteobacteria bacterium]|nr:50S ribosomal protein L9 [Deltaproteobacteria bacterium]
MKRTKIVLTKDYGGLGNLGDVVEVRAGFARNFLIPRGIAVPEVEAESLKKLRTQLELERQEAIKKAKSLAAILSGQELIFTRKVSEGNKIFGSVSVFDIQQELKSKGIELDQSMIKLTEPIRQIGKFSVLIKLHSQVTSSISVVVMEEKASDKTKFQSKTKQKVEEKKFNKKGSKSSKAAQNDIQTPNDSSEQSKTSFSKSVTSRKPNLIAKNRSNAKSGTKAT